MKRFYLFLLAAVISFGAQAGEWVRVNQLGYLPDDIKVAVYLNSEAVASANAQENMFQLVDAVNGKVVFSAPVEYAKNPGKWALKTGARLNFSEYNIPGGYYVQFRDAKSPVFRIGTDVYDGLSDFLLTYMRQQRCGDNPLSDKPCHQHDGYIIYHPTKSGAYIDVRGGWHDAGDFDLRVESQSNESYILALTYEAFHPNIDVTAIDFDNHNVEIHEPDGTNDILQQVENGMLTVVNSYLALGRFYRGIICNSLRQYVLLGDASSMTDGIIGNEDDRWVILIFSGKAGPVLESVL